MYTDFANHVGPIVMALRDRGVQAIGYYGKMSETEKVVNTRLLGQPEHSA